MMIIKVTKKGNFNKTRNVIKNIHNKKYMNILERIGRLGVDALSRATPVDTDKTSNSWGYSIEQGENSVSVVWTNSNIVNGWANVAVLIQYGHATRNGGYVQGRDYINPAMRPLFDQLAKEAWEAIIK